MYLIRDKFRCKPGKSTALVEKFKHASTVMPKGVITNARVLVDVVADYWTVVLETEVESLDGYEKEVRESRSKPEIQKAFEGYMDLVEGGSREIFRIM